MAASLRALVGALEDDPYCGTRPPHWPGGPLRLGDLQEIIASSAALRGPQPEPWLARGAAAAAVVFQQVRLFQLGASLQARGGVAAEMGGAISTFASESFDDWGEDVPISVLIAWLLHHGPPPPEPWWLTEISQSVAQLTLAARMEGQFGGAIQHAALGALREQLGALQAAQRQQER